MEIDGKQYEHIVITKADTDPDARLVTADDKKEVIAVISDDEVIEKKGYEVKLVPVTPNY